MNTGNYTTKVDYTAIGNLKKNILFEIGGKKSGWIWYNYRHEN